MPDIAALARIFNQFHQCVFAKAGFVRNGGVVNLRSRIDAIAVIVVIKSRKKLVREWRAHDLHMGANVGGDKKRVGIDGAVLDPAILYPRLIEFAI